MQNNYNNILSDSRSRLFIPYIARTEGGRNNKIYNIQNNHNKILRDSILHFFIPYADHNERGQKKSSTKESTLEEPEQLVIELIFIYGIILIIHLRRIL